MENFTFQKPALYLAVRHHSLKIHLTKSSVGFLAVILTHSYDDDDHVSVHITLEDIDPVIETLKTMKIELQARQAQMLEEELQYIREQNACSH